MLRKISLATAVAVLNLVAFSQDSTKKITFSGSIDAYYRYDLAGTSVGTANNRTSFTNSNNSFELGMATLRIDASGKNNKITALVDLGFGRRAEEFSYNDGVNSGSSTSKNDIASLSVLKQAFVSYQASKNLKITAGKFATHVGYELLDAPLNRNYSMSYMFTNGPFFHTGVKADYVSGNFGAMLGVANFVDQSTTSNGVRNIIAQLSHSFKEGKYKLYLNYSGFGGSQAGANPSGLASLNQIDLVGTAALNSKWSLGYNGTIQNRKQVAGSATANGSWIGNALYINYDPKSNFGLTLRSEYISDNKTVYFTTKSILANTLTASFKVADFTFIAETRYESANSAFYTKGSGAGSKSGASALFAAVYKF